MRQQELEFYWRQAIEAGTLAVWDLRPELETVHYSPNWKLQLGFPEPDRADSTHFWRCRVHPDDLEGMLAAMDAHAHGPQASYEAAFRLRSNGSGYRLVHSRGRAIERSAEGHVLRMVGTMIDLTDRPFTPRGGLPDGPRGSMEGKPLALPFHQLLGVEGPAVEMADSARAQTALERDRVLSLVDDLLQASMAQLAGLGAA
ncbi:MAG TPA: PAS domain-containing protein [Burkholderiaceae bacterium]